MAPHAWAFDEKNLNAWQLCFILFALLLVLPGCLAYFDAAAQGHIRQTAGTVGLLEGVYQVSYGRSSHFVHGRRSDCGDSNLCGDYRYSILAIHEDTVEYHIDPSWFQPTLPRWFVEDGERVRFWYTSGPLANAQIVAITLGAKSYITDNYTHPLTHILMTAGLATLLLFPGLGLGWLGIFLRRLTLRHPRLAENLRIRRMTAQRHHKYIPIRPARRVAKPTSRRSRRARR